MPGSRKKETLQGSRTAKVLLSLGSALKFMENPRRCLHGETYRG